MSEEKLNIFYELINGFEIVGTLTDDGKKLIKDGVQYLQQENNQLKKELKATKEVVEEHLKKEIQLKEVIEEVRDVIEKMIDVGYVDGMTCYYPTKNDSEFGVRAKILLQILDKGESNE